MICNKCGANLPDRAKYCHVCGSPSVKMNLKEKFKITGATVERKLSAKNNLLTTFFLICLALVVMTGVGYSFGNIKMPNIEGMELSKAQTTLSNKDVSKKDIVFVDELKVEIKDKTKSLYIVVDQQPESGTIIREGDPVKVICEDRHKKAQEAFEECIYKNIIECEEKAKEFQYDTAYIRYEEKNNVKANGFTNTDKEEYLAYDVKNVNHDNQNVKFMVDKKSSIEKRLSKQFDECINDELDKALKIAKKSHLDTDINMPTEAKFEGDFYDLNEAKRNDYIVTKINSINLESRTVYFDSDTKTHIAAVKKEQEFLKQLKSKIPYKGLDEEYISKTMVGVYDDMERSDDSYYDSDNYYDDDTDSEDETKYIWKSDDGNYETLIVTCVAGKVTSVEKKDTSIFWTSVGKPNFSADKDKILAEREKQKEENITRSSSSSSSDGGRMVWIPRTGHKYHSDKTCSNMRNPSQVSISEAKNMGYGPCSKCAY